MLVENKPGAGGNLGAEVAIKSPADGYTYLTISGSYAGQLDPAQASFNSLNDIVAIGQFTDEPTVLRRPSRPCRRGHSGAGRRSAKREPGKLAYGSSGPGGLSISAPSSSSTLPASKRRTCRIAARCWR